MPKLTQFFFSKTLLNFCAAVFCFWLILFSSAFSQAMTQPNNNLILPDRLGDTFHSVGKTKTLPANQCSVLPDGDVYKEYWLESLTSGHYTDGKNAIAIEIFQMQFDSGAYGLFTFNRGNQTEKRQEFFTGRFFVSISSETIKSISLEPVVQSLKEHLTSSEGELSPLPSHLPEEGKIADSEKYLVGPAALAKIEDFSNLKDVVTFSGGTEAVIARYHNGSGNLSLMIVEYHTPQLATDGYVQFQNWLGQLSEQERNRRLLKRIGNYVVTTTGTQDLAAAEKLVSNIKYTQVVYWEARKITDIPIAYRPPDPLAVQEMSQTASIMIRTFYWIGVMLFGAIVLGVISGGAFFYWNRYRRRKLGLDDVFSDAGGTVRLNLDEYLLSPLESKTGKTEEDEKMNRL
ncbi:MAG: hypothetical protein KA368_07750 [Acidobacteria bacterium]|nr:hypothetical protein [Acidobacteriota bacterium]